MYHFDKVKGLLDDALANHSLPCSDIAISVDNEIVFRYSNGTGDDDKQVPIKGDELYFLYSASKPITCVAALQLYEQGKLGLEDCVYEYLPEYRDLMVRTGEGVQPVKTPMRIRHLFTMTSGLNYDLGNPAIREQLAKNPASTTLELIRALAKNPLDFNPGEHFQYSLSHDVLAAVIEVVSGMTFGEYLQKHIFDVCGMKHTYVGYTPELKTKICSQYRYHPEQGESLLMEKENEFILSSNYQSGGAGLVSCVDDYMRFAQTLVNSEILLKKETLDLMRQGQLAQVPYEDFQNCKAGYSYGLGVRTNVEGKFSAVGEFGWDGAAGAYVLLDPDNHLAIFYATHVRDHGTYQYDELHPQIRDAVYETL